MKKLLFILCMLPVLSFAQDYKYNRVTIVDKGTDGFSLAGTMDRDARGVISVEKEALIIDGKEYKFKKRISLHTYKAKGCVVQLKYCGDNLCFVYIESIDRNKVYRIDHSLVANNNK